MTIIISGDTGVPVSPVTGTLAVANGGTGTTSTTFVNLATNVTGTLPVANLPAGSVVQVINATTTTATSTTSSSFVATLLTASITPRSASNKILVQVTGPIDSAATNSQANGTIYRGATILSGAGGFTNIFSNSGRIIGSLAMTHLDSPATTSSTTYTVYISGSAGATIIFPQGTNTASIILMEIQG